VTDPARLADNNTMSKSMKIAIPLVLGVVFLGYLVISSLSLSPITCEVTVEFRGRQETRRASGQSESEATLTAVNNACTLITNGRDESIACSAAEPVDVECFETGTR
jgi:hypothetical protein